MCVCGQGAFSRLDPSGTFQNVVKSRIPTGRLGEISEFSNLACYLVSDYSSWMTGSVSTNSLSVYVWLSLTLLTLCLSVRLSVTRVDQPRLLPRQ